MVTAEANPNPPAIDSGGTATTAPGTGTGTGADANGMTLSALASRTAIVALVLFALQQSLRLPSGFGVENWLGWTAIDSIRTVTEAWCSEQRSWEAAAAYLLIDQGLFVPLYAALTLLLSLRLRTALAGGSTRLGVAVRWLLGRGMALAVAALVVVDTVENLSGAARLGLPLWIFAIALVAGAVLAVALWARFWLESLPPALRRWPSQRWLWFGLALLALALAPGLAWKSIVGCQQVAAGIGEGLALATAFAHGWKQGLIGLVLLIGIAGGGVWWFGGEFRSGDKEEGRRRRARATFRGLAAAVVGRSRYVIGVLAVFAALILALDQCRDVLLALVQVRGASPLEMLRRLALLATGSLAAGLLAHSCWLWTRLAGMVERSGLELTMSEEMRNDVGRFAQGYARALALVPLGMVCVLVAYTMGDLVLASRQAPDGGFGAVWSAGLLVAFAALTLGVAGRLIDLRRRLHLKTWRSYYNAEPDVYALLWYGSSHLEREPEAEARVSRVGRALAFITRPWLLPVVALLGMALLRMLGSAAPEAMATTPATLVVLMFALTWWLGVLGVVSLWEQHDALPWLLLPLAAAGLFSALSLTDNHALGWPLTDTMRSLGDLQSGARLALLALAAAGGVAWFACVLEPERWPWNKRWPRASRWAAGLSGLVLAHGLLVLLDRGEVPEQKRAAACASARGSAEERARQCPGQAGATLAQVLGTRLAEVPLGAGPIYLVAAEGGGVRSAYWTAQVLARMHDDKAGQADFDRRLLLLSGVSGGSMGHVAYLACARLQRAAQASAPASAPAQPPAAVLPIQPLTAQALAQCIDERFARMDALTPLLGGLLFEDVFSRVLPLARGMAGCTHPGCAHVNRAESFEREWIGAFSDGANRPLAEGLLERRPGEPIVAFNSTWVETGNRTVALNVRLAADALPAATQLTRCMGADVRLVSAAHTSARFPVTNPLAGVLPHGAADTACGSGGHLIDGGYFDNSAVPTLLDTQRELSAALIAAKRTDLVPTYLLIRNGQPPQSCEQARASGPEPHCIRPEPGRRPDPQELDHASDVGRLTLYADVLGPALGLLNVSGIGAHGRQTPATLRAALGETGKPCGESRVWLIDQVDDGSLVPLGWYLSPAARAAMTEQARQRVPGACR